MLISVTMAEGECWSLVEASALDILDAMDTGILKTKWAGEITPAAMKLSPLGGGIIYDFILKKNGYCPVDFRRDYYSMKFLWA